MHVKHSILHVHMYYVCNAFHVCGRLAIQMSHTLNKNITICIFKCLYTYAYICIINVYKYIKYTYIMSMYAHSSSLINAISIHQAL